MIALRRPDLCLQRTGLLFELKKKWPLRLSNLPSMKASIHMYDAQRDLTVLVGMIYSVDVCPGEMERMWIHALQLSDRRLFHCNIALRHKPLTYFLHNVARSQSWLEAF